MSGIHDLALGPLWIFKTFDLASISVQKEKKCFFKVESFSDVPCSHFPQFLFPEAEQSQFFILTLRVENQFLLLAFPTLFLLRKINLLLTNFFIKAEKRFS